MFYKSLHLVYLNLFTFLLISCTTTKLDVVENHNVSDKIIDNLTELDAYQIPIRYAFNQTLPDWFDLSKYQSNENIIFSIGISDPKLDPIIATKQAIIRAKLVTALLINSEINNSKENYSNFKEVQNTSDKTAKFIRYQIVKSNLNFDESQFQIIDSYVTNSGEKIILMAFTPDNSSISKECQLKANINLMQTEYNIRTKFQDTKLIHCEQSITNLNNEEQAIYKLYKMDEASEIVSTLNNDTINNATYYCKYLLHDAVSVPEHLVKTKLYYGLWKAFFESLMIQLTTYISSNDIVMQTLNDDYRNENGNINQSINHQLQNQNFSGKIIHIFISENELTLQIEKTKP
jgi:hypothetical protein